MYFLFHFVSTWNQDSVALDALFPWGYSIQNSVQSLPTKFLNAITKKNVDSQDNGLLNQTVLLTDSRWIKLFSKNSYEKYCQYIWYYKFHCKCELFYEVNQETWFPRLCKNNIDF